jgi:pimeloyl-ACP methyl ester carboxylesterase
MRGIRIDFRRAGHQPARRECAQHAANAYNFGLGAGFYVHRRKNLSRATTASEATSRKSCRNILGHSMGGHGALTAALRNPDHYRGFELLREAHVAATAGLQIAVVRGSSDW